MVYCGLSIFVFILYHYQLKLSLEVIFFLHSFIFILGYIICVPKVSFYKINLKLYKDEIKDMWGYSKWLITSAFLSFSSTNIFYFVGGALLGSVSLGAVRATQTLMGVFNVLLQFLDNYLPIKLINIFSDGKFHEMNRYLVKTALILIVLIFLSLIFSFFYAENIYQYVFGKSYTKFSYLLNWFLFSYLFLIVNTMLRNGLKTIGHTKPIFYSYLINSFVSIFSVVPLIKFFEVKGLLFGIIVTQIVSIGYLYKSYQSRRHNYLFEV